MKYSVWLFTRPTSHAMIFPPLAALSNGKHSLCHWGVLVSQMSLVDAQAIFLRTTDCSANSQVDLGIMYELHRDANNLNTVAIIRPFLMANIREEWSTFSTQYVGQTAMTHEMIEREAIRLVAKHPNYHVFENNCQNFIKFLLEVVCPNAPIPHTIRSVLAQLRDISNLGSADHPLPGAYPKSTVSSSPTGTATTMTWVTASQSSWVSAVECFPTNTSIMGEESLTIAVTTTAGQFSEPIPPTSTRKGSGIAARVRALLHRGASRKQTSLDAVYQYDMKMLKISPKLRNKESKVDRVGRNVIHVAARYGNAETLQLLLAAGFSHNALDCDGFIPLTHALLGGNINAFNLLIKAGSDLTTRDREGRTPLHNAITNYPTSHEKFAVVKILLEAGADVSKTDWKGRTALHFAVETGAKDIVKLLVEWGSEVSVPDDDGRTPLHAAVNFHGNDEVEIVQTLLNAGSDVSAQDGFGDTPLYTSLHQQTIRAQIVKLLLQAGSDLEVDNGRGCTPLRRLYEADIRLTVLPPDADPFSPGGICDGKALRAAAEYGYEDIVRGCLDAGCNPSTPGKNGRTPLHWGSNQPHIVKLLLDRGSNVSAQDMYGKTPLFCAIHSPDSVKLLLGAGADVQVQSKDRTTPLHIAAREPQCDVLDMFIKAGADISARDNLGRTALLILATFATREDKDGIEALYYHSKSSVASSSTGQIKQESKEMGERLRAMLLLVNAGADLLARDKKGRTVLDLCS